MIEDIVREVEVGGVHRQGNPPNELRRIYGSPAGKRPSAHKIYDHVPKVEDVLKVGDVLVKWKRSSAGPH